MGVSKSNEDRSSSYAGHDVFFKFGSQILVVVIPVSTLPILSSSARASTLLVLLIVNQMLLIMVVLVVHGVRRMSYTSPSKYEKDT